MSFAHQSRPSAAGVTDHGLLTGLLDDDHPQYALADKSSPDPWVAAADLAARSIADLGTKDHDLLDGLDDDDHTQYALLSGRSGGQSLIGGLAASEHLTLQSTAHATRGYVRAQDDLQLLSNILRDSGGNNRVQLATSSPELNFTGDVKVSSHLGLHGTTPASDAAIKIAPTSFPTTFKGLDFSPMLQSGVVGMYGIYMVPLPFMASGGSAYGVFGNAIFFVPSGAASGVGHALSFEASAGGGGGGAVWSELTGCRVKVGGAMVSGGTVTTMRGLHVRRPTGYAVTTMPTVVGLDIDRQDPGVGTLTDVIGVRMADIGGGTNKRLLELGPATPYLRLVGGAAPGAGLSNLWLNVGGTLYQVRTRTINGYSCLTID